MESEKKSVERRLVDAEKKLATEENGGKAPKSDWEFSREDWAQMAKSGHFKMRLPCMRKDGWRPDTESLDKLGLAPQDADVIQAASKKAMDRTQSAIHPYCAEILGSDELATKLSEMCGDIVRRHVGRQSQEGAQYAQKTVAEMRAGLRPLPAPGDKVAPLVGTFLAETAALGIFEEELAKTMGPARSAPRFLRGLTLRAALSVRWPPAQSVRQKIDGFRTPFKRGSIAE